jgi:hypothetical protein
VFSVPRTAPIPITTATMLPSTVISRVSWRDCFA